MTDKANEEIIVLTGSAGSGKTTSLSNLADRDDVLYFNLEDKALPFPNKFKEVRPETAQKFAEDILKFQKGKIAKGDEFKYNIIVIDSITNLLNKVVAEQVYIHPKQVQLSKWVDYSAYFQQLVNDLKRIPNTTIILLAHVKEVFDEKTQRRQLIIPCQGSLKNMGIESYFSSVFHVAKVRPNQVMHLPGSTQNYYTVTPEEEYLENKHVIFTHQVSNAPDTTIRSPKNLFPLGDAYIDNDISVIINQVKNHYNK